jgi:hypothetical protein
MDNNPDITYSPAPRHKFTVSRATGKKIKIIRVLKGLLNQTCIVNLHVSARFGLTSHSVRITSLSGRLARNIVITILGIIHRHVCYFKQRFRDWILSPSSAATHIYLAELSMLHMKRQNAAAETSCFK